MNKTFKKHKNIKKELEILIFCKIGPKRKVNNSIQRGKNIGYVLTLKRRRGKKSNLYIWVPSKNAEQC